MRHLLFLGAIAGLVGLAVGPNFAAAAGGGGKGDQGAIVQTVPPPVSQNPSLPPLHLTDAQRAKIRGIGMNLSHLRGNDSPSAVPTT
jgi:hypothetical protein